MSPRGKRSPVWIPKAVVLAIHERLLLEHGGPSGFVDEHRLDAALASPINHFLHGESDLFRLAGAYAYSLAQDHPFVDGNKRVALTVSATFLELNGIRLSAPEPEAVQMIVDLASGRARAIDFAEWARPHSAALRSSPTARRRKKK